MRFSRHHSRRLILILIVCGVAAVCVTPARGQVTADSLSDEQVRSAIEAIREELYAMKHPVGFWEPTTFPTGETKPEGGYTSLVVLALLHAGESYQSPRLRDAVEYLEKLNMDQCYARTVRALVWSMLPPRFESNLIEDQKWLNAAFNEPRQGWSYSRRPPIQVDNSITQLAALALWEAQKRGVVTSTRRWQTLEHRFVDMQLADGGWNYRGRGDPSFGSMTTAGLATLFILQDLLHAGEAERVTAARDSEIEKSIALALDWMDERFSATENPGKSREYYYFYYMFGVERVALASGYKYFGGMDWYRHGAAEIINRLCTWDPAAERMTVSAGTRGAIRIRELAFGLMFLSRGRVPVAINKLRTAESAWNNRPRDVANITRWIRDRSETELNWQIVDLAEEAHEWLDAPLLYVASHEAVPWIAGHEDEAADYLAACEAYLTQRRDGALPIGAEPPSRPSIPQLDRIRRYLDLGGQILALAEGDGAAFEASIEQAGRIMYPQYQWRTLEPNHWAYTLHMPVERPPELRALSNGVRDLIVLAPNADLPRTFQISDDRVAHFNTVENVYLYASELNQPRPRLARHHILDKRPEAPALITTIVRAVHAGNWKPEPLALSAFRGWAAEERGMDLKVTDWPLSAIHQLDESVSLVVVSDTTAHEFTQDELSAIKTYVEGGGVILFETPGGRGDFTASAERAMQTLFNQPIRSMLRHRVITGEDLPNAVNLRHLAYRTFSTHVFGARETTPRLRGMAVAGEVRLLFSREDISNALLDQPVWGVNGYGAASAREMLGNIVQYAATP